MLSSTNETNRPCFGAIGPAAGLAAICLAFAGVAHAQDECATAVTAVVGNNSFSTTTATASADAWTESQCTGTDLGWIATCPDIWFKFNPGQGGTATLTTCLAGSYDTSLIVYKGTTCGDKVQVACNGDGAANASCQQYYSLISNLAIDGTSTYYIRVGGWNGATGSGVLNIAFTANQYPQCGANQACGQPHATGGCSDVACCENVCGFDASCCDTAWTTDCVDLAVSLCGIFIYNCPSGGPANDCAANATVVTNGQVVNFNTANANTDGPGEAGCNSGNNDLPIHKDVWYRFTAAANGFATATNCQTAQFDSKIAAYNIGNWANFDPSLLPTYFVSCNEDCDADPTFYSSELTFPVVVGRTYLVRLGGFEGASGSGTIKFILPDPCALPSAGASEGEGCGNSTNPGCLEDQTTVAATTLALDTATSGTFWADNNFRDVDWYKFTITASSQVTMKLWSASNTIMRLYSGNPCTGLQLLASNTASACPQTLTFCTTPGTYYLALAIDGFTGAPCGSGAFNDYVVKAETAPANCSPLLGTECTNPGPDTITQNPSNVATTGGIACAFAAGPNTGTTQNMWARVFPANQVSAGELRCVQFGVWCTKWVDGVFQGSDLPQAATLNICKDLNGGTPTNYVSAGGDLEIIASFPMLVPGGAYVGAVSLATPLCLNGNDKNIVVVLDAPPVVPAQGGYQFRAGGNTVASGNYTYRNLSCADTQFILITTSAWNWYCALNGNFTTCGSANPCPWDLTGDHLVNGADLGALLANWGNPGTGDFNGDGTVNGGDLGALLANWGPCPN